MNQEYFGTQTFENLIIPEHPFDPTQFKYLVGVGFLITYQLLKINDLNRVHVIIRNLLINFVTTLIIDK
jgi:hypothetical protein